MTRAEQKLMEIERWLMTRYGVDAASRMLYPLAWYVNTGRAIADFLRRLYEAKTFVVGRLLAKEGSVDETVNRVKARI